MIPKEKTKCRNCGDVVSVTDLGLKRATFYDMVKKNTNSKV